MVEAIVDLVLSIVESVFQVGFLQSFAGLSCFLKLALKRGAKIELQSHNNVQRNLQ